MAEKATWKTKVLEDQEIVALVMAKDRVYLAGSKGALQIRNAADGKKVAERSIPVPLWDGLAVAGGKLYISTRDGKLLCLGDE